jgi:ABC-type antimicrobial peptide transport system permease subunit
VSTIEPSPLARALVSSDPNLNGPRIAVVRLCPGVPTAVGLASLQRIAATTTKALATDPEAGGVFAVLPVQQPAEIVNYRSIGATPTLLAAGVAAGAVVALGLTLAASTRRRHRDLALLKTLGFTHRQLATTVAWQASVAALIGVIVGIPLGIILGRWLWVLVAHEIYAVAQPTVPVLQVILVAMGALVAANLVAALPGRTAARTPTAVLLRAE